MMGGLGGARQLMEREVSKPKNVSWTLSRFWNYFRQRWFALVMVAILLIVSTYTRVLTPKLIGQAVDCYLNDQNQVTAMAGLAGGASDSQASASNCWFDQTDFSKMSAQDATDGRIHGLLGLVGVLVLLFIVGSILTCVMFYTMTWAGNHALWRIRLDVFRHVNRLSLGYYAENEAGNIMSRFTNDSDTIQQALSFALVNVLSGVLLIVWVMVEMLQENWAYALLSLVVVPFMMFFTVYFSNQARKAFRKSRQEMGSVNADLQESIAGVREVQAFNREDENIVNFRRTNAANRDANIRAAAFTSALTPVLEALGYVALGIVVVVGGISVLRNEPLLGTSIISLGTVFAFLPMFRISTSRSSKSPFYGRIFRARLPVASVFSVCLKLSQMLSINPMRRQCQRFRARSNSNGLRQNIKLVNRSCAVLI